jgi:hypothetical protein
MPTRRATWSDLLPASKILAEAFHDDYLFGDFIHPRRTEFPDDVYLYWLRFLREVYYTEPGEYLVVSYQEANNNNDNDRENNSPELEQNQQQQQNQTITGIAHWIRNHSTPPPNPLALPASPQSNRNLQQTRKPLLAQPSLLQIPRRHPPPRQPVLRTPLERLASRQLASVHSRRKPGVWRARLRALSGRLGL